MARILANRVLWTPGGPERAWIAPTGPQAGQTGVEGQEIGHSAAQRPEIKPSSAMLGAEIEDRARLIGRQIYIPKKKRYITN